MLDFEGLIQGLLLGTGPLVDPGYEGHLLVPLHNLTTNKYVMREGETFAWVEFTKIAPNAAWHGDNDIIELYSSYKLHGQYLPFPDAKKNLSAWDYLKEAHSGPIRSSIPDATEHSN